MGALAVKRRIGLRGWVAIALVIALAGLVVSSLALAATSSVTLTTAAPQLVVVPNVTGMTVPEATHELQTLGIRVNVLSESSANVPAGDIITEAPAPGGRMPVGSTVTLYSSAGP